MTLDNFIRCKKSFKTSVAITVSVRSFDYDTGWFALRLDETEVKDTGFGSIPINFTAYYKTDDGHVLPWGMNQYGDKFQSNGVLIDFDEDGKIYVRTPSKSPASRGEYHNGYLLHVGAFRNRGDTGPEEIFHVKNAEFRIIAWK